MARACRGTRRLVGLVTHAVAGSQFTSVRFTERLEEIGARPLIGTVADPYDNSMPWPRRPTVSTRRSAPTGLTTTSGTTSTNSNSRPCRGCTGSTRYDCTGTATTPRQRSTKQRSRLPDTPTPPGSESNRTSLNQTRGGSPDAAGAVGGPNRLGCYVSQLCRRCRRWAFGARFHGLSLSPGSRTIQSPDA